ncbi:MAG: efflux RND transporter periplasmic adaptor subunit [Deltaproteobacteria bacterium]|nr:MAG: efflux RND transporter periplasmic adaptor subunit [Deltaproteobacteria bacterium]
MRFLQLLAVTAVVGALTGCVAEAEQAAETPVVSDAKATRVEVVAVEPSVARVELNLPGEIEGSRDAALAAALGGYVESVKVEPGAMVKKGQHLVSVDASLYAAGVQQAEAQLELARADLGRVEALGDLASKAQLDGARTQVKVLEAGLTRAQAQYRRARITAPFAGTVASIDLEVGEVVGPGSPVARLVQLDPVRVSLSVPDRDVVALATGMEVEVTSPARSGVFSGRIVDVPAAADTRTRTFVVEVEVDNPDGELLPGMIARVRVNQELGGDAVVIPQDWVVTRLEGAGVFTERDGTAVWQPVELGRVTYDQVVVTSGVSFGDRIIINGHRLLVDGDAVLVSREGTCCSTGRPVF